MASTAATESRVIVDTDFKLHEVDLEGIDIEVLEINDAVLKSLLEDSNVDEQAEYVHLDDVIRDLEAEIDPNSLHGHDLEDESSSTDDGSGRERSRDWSEYSFDDFSWIDIDTVPSSPGEGMNWYMEEFGNEIINFIPDFGCVGDYYHYAQIDSNEEEPAFGSLWHDTSDDMMHQ